MRLHAVRLRPLGVAAGSLIKVAFLRAHDAGVCFSQPAKAVVTIPLGKTLASNAVAIDTKDSSGMPYFQFGTDQRIESN